MNPIAYTKPHEFRVFTKQYIVDNTQLVTFEKQVTLFLQWTPGHCPDKVSW